jgi:hypothetical protein
MAEEPRQKGVVEEFKELTEQQPRERKWPVMKIRSGPHAKDTEVEVDGTPITHLTRVDVALDVKDAVRVQLHQFAIVEAELEVHPNMVTRPTKVVVSIKGQGVVAEAKADTIWEALVDCARQLELAAKSDTGVAQAGTIKESSGRPPGH